MPAAAPAAAAPTATEEIEAVRHIRRLPRCVERHIQRGIVTPPTPGEAEGEDGLQREARGLRRRREAQDHP